MYRIFIVEDDEVIARVLGEHLRQWGYTTQCVQDFEHVLAEVDAFAPQLILLDISLPFFNGFHWCAELRRRSCVPIIFLSSASDQMNAVMAMQLGGDDFNCQTLRPDRTHGKNSSPAAPELRFFRTCQPASLRPGLSEHR